MLLLVWFDSEDLLLSLSPLHHCFRKHQSGWYLLLIQDSFGAQAACISKDCKVNFVIRLLTNSKSQMMYSLLKCCDTVLKYMYITMAFFVFLKVLDLCKRYGTPGETSKICYYDHCGQYNTEENPLPTFVECDGQRPICNESMQQCTDLNPKSYFNPFTQVCQESGNGFCSCGTRYVSSTG